jgi:hypothetical protein
MVDAMDEGVGMTKVIVATGMALLSIDVVTSTQATPVSKVGKVTLAEAVPTDDVSAARRGGGPKQKIKIDTGRTAAPKPTIDPATPVQTVTPEDARHRGGPKGGGRDKEMTGRTAAPDTSNDPATPTQATTPITPIDAPDAGRRKGPKGDSGSDAQGSTEVPAPDSAPAEERRREGPKGAGESGRTEAPAPDTQPAGRRREGPKGAVDHGRTSTTPLIIGALGTAAVLALVISSGNDRPASP